MEAHASRIVVVSWWQLAPIPPLLAIFVSANQGAYGGHLDSGVRSGQRIPSQLTDGIVYDAFTTVTEFTLL